MSEQACAKVLNLRELFFDLRLRTFVSKVLKLICFSVLSKVLKLTRTSVNLNKRELEQARNFNSTDSLFDSTVGSG